jgi:hypothetical protein
LTYKRPLRQEDDTLNMQDRRSGMLPGIKSENQIQASWYGQKVLKGNYLLGNLASYLPKFSREPFGEGKGINEYLQKIVRLPLNEDQRKIPVAIVSRRYALIQHKEVYSWLMEGLKALDYYSDNISVETLMSEYGERLHLAVHVPKFDYNPGDNKDLGLIVEARNSVDRSCAFEVRLRWRRLVCSNGLWIQEKDILRKIHNIDWMNRKNVADFINERVVDISGYKGMISSWHGTKISRSQIEEWADEVLTKKWGVHLAARCCHIARSGYDGIVGRVKAKTPASKYVVSSDMEVPGTCAPISNLYHLSQVLTWLAGNRKNIEDSDIKTSDIPKLLKHFISANNA